MQYPKGSEYLSSYIEARKGDYDVVFFGLQAFIKEYLSTPITHQDIDEAEMVIQAHGLTFNRAGWEMLVDKYGGYLPLRIEAIAEGSVVPASNVVCQIINTDPEFYWLPSYIETALLRAIWYPSTVASVSHYCKGIIRQALEKSAYNTESLIFRLHDFGSRGASRLPRSCASRAGRCRTGSAIRWAALPWRRLWVASIWANPPWRRRRFLVLRSAVLTGR